MQYFGKEYIEEDGDLFLRTSFPTDPFQWSIISGKLVRIENQDDNWLPIHLDTLASCGIFSCQKYCPSFFRKVGKGWAMVDGRDELWEWRWIDSSTDKYQTIDLKFRLRPSRWR